MNYEEQTMYQSGYGDAIKKRAPADNNPYYTAGYKNGEQDSKRLAASCSDLKFKS